MDDWKLTQMTPFDCRTVSQTLQITKLLIPYLPPRTQRIVAIYIKFMEFQNTLSSFHAFRQKSQNAQDIMAELRPYMPPSACESMDNLQNMMSMMEMFRSFHEMENGDSDFNPMSMMQGMLSPDQQSMFDMYNAMFDTNMNANTEGGENE